MQLHRMLSDPLGGLIGIATLQRLDDFGVINDRPLDAIPLPHRPQPNRLNVQK